MSQAYDIDKSNVEQAIGEDSKANTYVPQYQNIASNVGALGQIQQQNFDDTDQTESGLSAIAQAFHTMAMQGSPVLKAQENIQQAATARGLAQQNQLQQVGTAQQQGAQASQTAGQDQQKFSQQSEGLTNQNALAQLKQQAIQLQLTHAAAQEAIQKQALVSQATLSASASLEAQQNLVTSAGNSVTQIQQGESQLQFNDWMKGIQTASAAGGQAAAIGSQLGKSDTTTADPLGYSDTQAGSDAEEANAPDYTNQVTEIPE